MYDQLSSSSSEEAEHVRSLLKARNEEFALIQLAPAFGGASRPRSPIRLPPSALAHSSHARMSSPAAGIISFVKQNEAGLRSGKVTAESVDTRKIQTLIKSFADGWKRSIDAIDSDVMRSFPNFKNGTAILQEALTQLVLYYERFVALLKQVRGGQEGKRTPLLCVFLRALRLSLFSSAVRSRSERRADGQTWSTGISSWSK